MTLPATETRPAEARPRLTTAEKLIYGAGGFANGLMNTGLQNLVMPVFNLVLGVRPELIGIASSIPRIYDAFTDPLMGRFTDTFRSRWGRRRPLIVLGALLCGISFAGIWWCPRGLEELNAFIYLLVASILFYTAHTIWVIPYLAMGMALSPEAKERTRLWAVNSFFTKTASLTGVWILRLIELKIFDDRVQGARVVGFVLGLVVMVFAALPGLLLVERIVVENTRKAAAGFLSNLRTAIETRPFLQLSGALAIVVGSTTSVGAFGFYLLTYYVHRGDTVAGSQLFGLFGTVQFTASLCAIPLVTFLANRFGNKRVMLGCLVVSSLGFWSTWLTMKPSHPYLVFISALLIAPAVTAAFQLYWPLLTAICDWDEQRHHQRREGTFSSLGNWFVKASQAGAFFITGFLLSGTGFDAKAGPIQPAETLTAMRVLYAAVPGTLLLLAFRSMWRLPVDVRPTSEARVRATP